MKFCITCSNVRSGTTAGAGADALGGVGGGAGGVVAALEGAGGAGVGSVITLRSLNLPLESAALFR